jgi:hypothetical protein
MSRADADGGYALIYRSLLDHPAFRDEPEAMAFASLVLRAAWKPTRVRYKDRVLVLERGQLAMSVRDFAKRWGKTKDWAQRFFDRLEASQMVSRNRDRTETGDATAPNVITICNYDKYQVVNDKAATATDREPRQHRDSTATQNKEMKEGKEGKKEENIIGISDRKNGVLPLPMALPPWLPAPTWQAYLTMRKSIKKPASDFVQQRVLAKLERLKVQGYDPVKVLERTIIGGWPDVYEPKGVEAETLRSKPSLGL